MPPKSNYPDQTWLDEQYTNYPPSFGHTACFRAREERPNFMIYEDPDCEDEGDETAATPVAHSPTDSDQKNPNEQSNINAETNPASQANIEHPVNNNVPETPGTFAATGTQQTMLTSIRQPVASATENPNEQSNINAETIPGSQANMEHPVNNNVPETPGTFATIGIQQLMLGSIRQPVASATENFIIRGNNNAHELDAPPSPSPALGHALPSADGSFAGESNAETRLISSPRINVGERWFPTSFYRTGIDDTDLEENFDQTHTQHSSPSHWDQDVWLTPIRNTRVAAHDRERFNPPIVPPLIGEDVWLTPIQTTRAAADDCESFNATTPPPLIGEEDALLSEIQTTRVAIRDREARAAARDHESFITTIPPPFIGEDVGLTQNQNTRAAAFPLAQSPASRMPPPRTPTSHMRPLQSPASRLLRPRGSTPAIVVRSSGTHHGFNATPVVRRLFRDPGTNLNDTPAPNHNAWEPQLVRQQTPHNPLHPSCLRAVSFISDRNEDTEMASPSVTTPEFQTGGTPPTPLAPRTPKTWISPSHVTPEIVARTIKPPVYINRDEPMEITPSPPGLLASPKDKEMADAFWTPNKARAPSTIAGFEKKDGAAQKKNVAPVENKSPIVDSAPFDDAVAQDFAPLQKAIPIRKPVPVLDTVSPGTTTVRTVISTEITTTITTTPSPPQSPVPARRAAASLRPSAAKPRRASHAPRRQAASTPQRKGKGGAGQKTNRRHTADQVVLGGINRRQELRISPRYSLRDSTRGTMPGTYSLTPVRNKTFGLKSAPGK